ncbi:MAG TPA: tyrosine-type recombinase/integrase [Desulfatiglandales bacterium]|nr:tyrosine-type recombinase/integrase [Desulfatiglandales bacterium]
MAILDKAIIEESKKKTTVRKNKLPVTLEPEEVQNLLKQPSKRYPTGLRNKAIMSLMLHCGVRLSEVVNLKPGNINLTKGKLRVESGKGKKDRDLAIPDYLNDLLEAWRSIRPKSNYFFSTLKGRKLSDRYIQQMVKRYASKAGIEKKISPHTLRHTYATQYYKQTKDIETLSEVNPIRPVAKLLIILYNYS